MWRKRCALTFVLVAVSSIQAEPPATNPPMPRKDTSRKVDERPDTKTPRGDIYDAAADAEQQIAAALERARHENRRILVMYGDNGCVWCHRLHAVFEENDQIADRLGNDFVLVMVDVDGHNQQVPERYGADLQKHGLPFLTVLDSEGKALVNQNTSDLEDGRKHDVEKVDAFLKTWAPAPLDAEQELSDALAAARQHDQRVLIHIGAPGCVWCRVLGDFLDTHHKLFNADYVLVKIDTVRMTHGNDVSRRLRSTDLGGIPWIAILDEEGKTLITSDGPGGNIGYPAAPREIEHFLKMLNTTARSTTPEQIAEVEKLLQEAGREIDERRAMRGQ